MNRYFENFKRITYGKSNPINIMERAAILNMVFSSVYSFYPYKVKNGMRARTIAEKYYNDPNLDWLVYFSNNIVDPYHQWPMDEKTFNSFIIQKYGSLEAARTKVVSYRVNWYEDDRNLSKIQYDSLPANEKRYWSPVFDQYNRIVSFNRREIDHLSIAQDENGEVSLSVPSGEEAYWAPVTALEYEEEENAKKSNIKLLDAKLVSVAINNLKQLMAE